ncbi:MAG: two-component regulator propeller domain-containing protein [Candidatus Polarisedimenticolia bacterium]
MNLLAAMMVILATLGRDATAGPACPHAQRLGSAGGPPAEVITALHRDREGLVWLGSRDGLALYDGSTFTQFRHDPADPSSISDNTVRTIFEDREGRLWFGTNTGGLNLLDRSRWNFIRFRHDESDPASLSHDSVYAIADGEPGELWVGTQVGLNRLDVASGRFQRFDAGHDYVTALLRDPDGRLWVATNGGGLSRRDPRTGEIVTWRHSASNPASLPDDAVFALSADSGRRIWAGTAAGLCAVESSGTVQRVPINDDRPGEREPLITALSRGPSGALWMGTLDDGLREMIPGGGVLAWRGACEPWGDLARRVASLMVDQEDTVWAGSWGGGAWRVTQASRSVASVRARLSGIEGLRSNDITAMAGASDGSIWIGTRAGDLARLDGSGGAPRIVPVEGDPSIYGIVPARDGSLWIGTGVGVLKLESQSGSLTLQHDPDDPSSLGPGYVVGLLQDRAGRIWVGTGEGGLHRLDASGRVAERYLHDPARPDSLSDAYVTALLEDRRGTLWVGTRSGGLNRVEPGRPGVVRYRAGPEPGSLGSHFVTSLLEDRKGRLWIGTGGGGLNRADQEADGIVRFTRITSRDGLIDDNIMGMVEDDDGSLWLSTKRGLSRYDPDAGSVVSLTVDDGLISGEFESGSAARTGDLLFFGSVRGLVAYPAGTPFPRSASPMRITSIQAAGEAGPGAPAGDLRAVEIPYGRWISLELSILDFEPVHRHAHAYRLGPDEPWTDLGPRRTLTLVDLPPGTHLFMARGRGCQGTWTELPHALAIHVIPPFWMTAWFRSTIAVALVGSALGAHRLRMSALRRRNDELLKLQEQREKARHDLGAAYARLRLLTRRLEAAKEEERRSIARELHDELGPSLTAVGINLQLLEGDHPGSAGSSRLAESTDLIDRMIQHIRSLSLNLRPPLLEEMGLVASLRGYLETHAERSSLVLEMRDSGVARGSLTPELEISAFRVVQEAVANVVRHAGARSVNVTLERRGSMLHIDVRDDGDGFDVQAVLGSSATGKALGLLGMQERVGALGGELTIESSPGHGTRVHASLPLEDAA